MLPKEFIVVEFPVPDRDLACHSRFRTRTKAWRKSMFSQKYIKGFINELQNVKIFIVAPTMSL
jgi:hypothetical protein